MVNLSKYLRGKQYPGRGIVVGTIGDDVVVAYFIMGRSANSKNRIFVKTSDGIKTQAFDEGKMSDPSLIIYNPIRNYKNCTIVTNGDQTDTIYNFISKGDSFETALKTREFEPDEPNYTPRISAIVEKNGDFKMSILKSDEGESAQCLRYFYEYETPVNNTGRIIHTYEDNGNPIPSFYGEPCKVVLTGDIDTFTDSVWTNLHADYKVSLFVKFTSRVSGLEEVRIINKNK